MFHISDIKKFKKCPRLYFLNQNSNFEYQPFLRNDEELTDLIIKFLNLDKYYLGIKGDDKDRIINELDSYEWFVKARFEYNNLRIKIPFLHKCDDGYDIYFALYALYPHDDDVEFYRANIWVLENLGFKINNIYIIHLNANYILKDKLNVDELFLISSNFYNIKNHPSVDIKQKIYQKAFEYNTILKDIENSSLEDYNAIKKRACKARGLCQYYYDCFEDEVIIEDDSILNLVSSEHKNEMYKNGIRLLKDADINRIEGTRCQYAQIMASRNNGLYFDYYALKTWLNNLKKPIAFIDFEWERYIVPPFNGLKPYDVVCFEYSLHLLDETGKLHHETFIGTHDCREDFIRSLIKNIPNDATIVAYNAIGAEMLRIKELANQFPKYQDALNSLNERFGDMSYPFISGIVYDIKMKGNYSVKSLLNVVSELNYNDLSIHDGMDAVYKWRIIDKETDGANFEEIKNSLIEYCSMDSYALYLIYKWLIEIVESKDSEFVNKHKE